MIGIDTNVLIRYIVEDDAKQTRIANRFISNLSIANPGFLSSITMIELVWVLETSYKTPRKKIVLILEKLFFINTFQIEHNDLLFATLDLYRNNSFDFSDIFITLTAQESGALHTVTFNQKAARIPGMQELKTQ